MTLILAAGTAHAGVVESPTVVHTEALDRIISHQLRWLRGERLLVASVTFSNVDYVSREEPRRDERYDFLLPDVRLDDRTGIFYDAEGEPVAAIRHELTGSEIRLLPSSQIRISNESGTIRLTLSVTPGSRQEEPWEETNRFQMLPPPFG